MPVPELVKPDIVLLLTEIAVVVVPDDITIPEGAYADVPV